MLGLQRTATGQSPTQQPSDLTAGSESAGQMSEEVLGDDKSDAVFGAHFAVFYG